MSPEEKFKCRTALVHFWDAGASDEDSEQEATFHKRFSRPTIELDLAGNMKQVSFNNQVRSSQHFQTEFPTREVYLALQLLNTICYRDFSVKYKLSPGDLAVFDNLRVMHGREGYIVQPGTPADRHLRGTVQHSLIGPDHPRYRALIGGIFPCMSL